MASRSLRIKVNKLYIEISMYSRGDYVLNLMKLRKEKNMTRYQLAKMTGISESTLRSIELEVNNPGYLHVKKICEALNINIHEVEELK